MTALGARWQMPASHASPPSRASEPAGRLRLGALRHRVLRHRMLRHRMLRLGVRRLGRVSYAWARRCQMGDKTPKRPPKPKQPKKPKV